MPPVSTVEAVVLRCQKRASDLEAVRSEQLVQHTPAERAVGAATLKGEAEAQDRFGRGAFHAFSFVLHRNLIRAVARTAFSLLARPCDHVRI